MYLLFVFFQLLHHVGVSLFCVVVVVVVCIVVVLIVQCNLAVFCLSLLA